MLTRRCKSKREDCEISAASLHPPFDWRSGSSKLSVMSPAFVGNAYLTRKSLYAGCDRKPCCTRSLTELTYDQQQQHGKERKRTKSLTREMTQNVALVAGTRLRRPFPSWQEARGSRACDDAGRRIVTLLMLHAWRRRREDNAEAHVNLNKLNNQVDNLNMQVYLLRKLLDNEKLRVTIAAKDIQKNLMKIEEYEQERRLFIKEQETLESEIHELQDLVTDLKNKCKNQKNDLATARLEVENWENRLKKERKKLKALKDEKIILQKEAQSREDALAFQAQDLEQLNKANKELQDKLDGQVLLLNEAISQVHSAQEKLKLSEESEMKQEKIICEKDEEIKKLKAQIAHLELKLQEHDDRNGELGKLIAEKTKELMMMNDKLTELTKSQKFWGNRVLKMASLCTRIPLACFYTVATLLLPQPYRSF